MGGGSECNLPWLDCPKSTLIKNQCITGTGLWITAPSTMLVRLPLDMFTALSKGAGLLVADDGVQLRPLAPSCLMVLQGQWDPGTRLLWLSLSLADSAAPSSRIGSGSAGLLAASTQSDDEDSPSPYCESCGRTWVGSVGSPAIPMTYNPGLGWGAMPVRPGRSAADQLEEPPGWVRSSSPMARWC